jgi:N-formylglutamate amidohydrolase
MATGSHDRLPHIRLGPPGAATPLVIAVPHAGRHYPRALLDAARLPRHALETIEDRHADLLVADAVVAGAVAIVARVARACIDLNRDPREVDPASVRRTPDDAAGWLETEKVAGGLGIVPSRIATGGAVWKRPLDPAEVARRIAEIHAPYHQAIAAALDAAQARHGHAVLLDCHSMPPLGPVGAARIVIGDRHGASAAPRYAAAVERVVARHDLACARNRPYAGGFTLDRHGAPRTGRHALQIEFDRSLYLNAGLRLPGPGLASAQGLLAEIAEALLDAEPEIALAAE